MGLGWGDSPQDSIEDDGEGQEDHGGSTASLGNVYEGLHRGLIQDRPLWVVPPNKNPINWRPGPHTPKAWPCPQPPLYPGQEPRHFWNCWDGRGGALLPAAGRRRSGGHSGRPSCGLRPLWSSPWKTSLLMTQGRRRGSTAEGRAGKGKREFRRGKEEGTALLLESCPLRTGLTLTLPLPGEGPPGPTFSLIPEFTAEAHVLKPESGSQGRGRGDWAWGEEVWGSGACSVSQHVPALGGSKVQPVVTQEPRLKHLMYPRSACGVWTGVGGRGVCLGAPLGKCTCEQMCKAVCVCVWVCQIHWAPLGASEWSMLGGTWTCVNRLDMYPWAQLCVWS